MFNLLEGDGVIENIYHLLWTKDSIFGTGTTLLNFRPLCGDSSHNYLQVPKTVLLVLHFQRRQQTQKEVFCQSLYRTHPRSFHKKYFEKRNSSLLHLQEIRNSVEVRN